MGADPSAPRECGDQVLLPLALLVGAVGMETRPDAASIYDVDETPRCSLESDHEGAHHGLVMNLAGPYSGAVWAVWISGGAPHLTVLPDCEVGTDDGMDGCCSFAGHVGRHTFALYDPLAETSRSVVALVWPRL